MYCVQLTLSSTEVLYSICCLSHFALNCYLVCLAYQSFMTFASVMITKLYGALVAQHCLSSPQIMIWTDSIAFVVWVHQRYSGT